MTSQVVNWETSVSGSQLHGAAAAAEVSASSAPTTSRAVSIRRLDGAGDVTRMLETTMDVRMPLGNRYQTRSNDPSWARWMLEKQVK